MFEEGLDALDVVAEDVLDLLELALDLVADDALAQALYPLYLLLGTRNRHRQDYRHLFQHARDVLLLLSRCQQAMVRLPQRLPQQLVLDRVATQLRLQLVDYAAAHSGTLAAQVVNELHLF